MPNVTLVKPLRTLPDITCHALPRPRGAIICLFVGACQSGGVKLPSETAAPSSLLFTLGTWSDLKTPQDDLFERPVTSRVGQTRSNQA